MSFADLLKTRGLACSHCGAPVMHMSIRSGAAGVDTMCRNGDHLAQPGQPDVKAFPPLTLRLAYRAVVHGYAAPHATLGTFEDPRDAADAIRAAMEKSVHRRPAERHSGGTVRAVMLVGMEGSWVPLEPRDGCTITPATRPLPPGPDPGDSA